MNGKAIIENVDRKLIAGVAAGMLVVAPLAVAVSVGDLTSIDKPVTSNVAGSNPSP